MGLSERCLWYRGIPTFPTGYNNNYHIFQNEHFVVILQEHIHDLRVITLDGRGHLPSNVRQFAGSSVGRWEGDTLVVETTNFSSSRELSGGINLWRYTEAKSGQGTALLVERFTRVDHDTVSYEFTLDDPETWTNPWSARFPLVRIDGEVFEYACHEGNYGLPGQLVGSRIEERAFAEGRGPNPFSMDTATCVGGLDD